MSSGRSSGEGGHNDPQRDSGMKTVFALVDCNNFYASGEKLFRPDLRDTPVIVLSNKSEQLMVVMDEINRKSRATLCMARAAGPTAYAMRREYLSPAYTTDWKALPEVR